MSSYSARIDRIRRLPNLLDELVMGLTDEQLTTAYQQGEWSIAQNVHHLADSHMNSFIRFKLILLEEKPALKPYDQDAWAQTAEANSADIRSSLAILRGLHARWCALMETLTPQQWARQGDHPEHGDVSLEDLLTTYAEHGEAHLRQIQAVLDALVAAD